jgi:DNA topoisomerase IB
MKRTPIEAVKPTEVRISDMKRTPITRITVPVSIPKTKTVRRTKTIKVDMEDGSSVEVSTPSNTSKKVETEAVTNSVDSFLKMLLVIVLKTYGQDTKQFREFTAWTQDAKPFLAKHGILKPIMVAANLYKTRGLYDDEVVELGAGLRAKAREGVFDGKLYISVEQRKLLKDITAVLRANPSDPAWNRIHSDVRILKDVNLNRAFVAEEDSVTSGMKSNISKLRTLIKKATGQESCFISVDDAMLLRKDNPTLSTQISGLTKILKAAIKKSVFSFVRTYADPVTSVEGNQIVPISDVQKYLSAQGLPNNLPIGLTGGQIDENGRIYTSTGLMLAGTPEGRVTMNPVYDPQTNNTYVCNIVRDGARNFEFRTVQMAEIRKDKKFGAVQEFLKNETQFRQKWLRMLSAKKHIDRVLGAMMELMYVTSARIGGKDNETAGEKTYGLTTLLVSHIKITAKRIEFDYTGKKGANQGAVFLVKTPHDIEVREILEELVQGKAADELVFTSNRRDSATGRPVFGSTLRVAMQALGIPITPHKFRHAVATKMAMDILATSKFKKGAKQLDVERWVKEAMIKVGVQLHHKNGENETSGTALKSYIDHSVVTSFFTNLNLHAPSFLRIRK